MPKKSDIPAEIMEEYKLHEIATEDGFVYCEIRKGMYGLPQAGIMEQELLEQHLAKVGYSKSKPWSVDTKIKENMFHIIS